MDSFTLKCQFGTDIVPVKIEPMGDLLRLTFPFHRGMIAEVKNMAKPGGGWNPDTKTWSVYNNRRNLFAFDIMVNGKDIAIYDENLRDESINEAWSHQNSMYQMLRTRKRCILAAEMRTGKTMPTLVAIEQAEKEYNDDFTAWWVAPKSALRGLKREIEKWNIKTEIELFTYEGFANKVKRMKDGFEDATLPMFLVFDECQKLKTPTSNRSKMACYMSDEMHYAFDGLEYVVGLSGTPAPKDPSDWWNICEVIQPGFILEGNVNKFKRRLGQWEQRDGAVGQRYWHLISWIPDEIDKLYHRLKPLVQVHLKKDCLDLPAIRYEIRELEPSEILLSVAETITDTESSILAAINKLRQLSDGFMYQKGYDPDKNAVVRTGAEYVGSPKEAALKEDLDTHEDIGRIIVYAGFQGSIDICTRIAVDAGWTVLQVDGRGWKVTGPAGTELKDADFFLSEMDGSSNTGEVEKLAFIAQTQAAGTGLELSASPTIIYYSNDNSGEGRMQSEARAHSDNMDKTRGLTVVDYCHLPSDYKIRESLMNKKQLQGISMGELQAVFRRAHEST